MIRSSALAPSICLPARFEPQAFLKGLEDERITIAPLVPTMWRMVLATQPESYDLSRVTLAFMSGEMAGAADVGNIHCRQITKRVRAAIFRPKSACSCGIILDEDEFLLAQMLPPAVRWTTSGFRCCGKWRQR